MSTSQWRQNKSQEILSVTRLHPLGTLIVCTKLNDNPSKNRSDN